MFRSLTTAALLAAAPAAQAATLIHAYDFNDGTADDLVGSLDGSFFGGASVAGGVLVLDGVDDYVRLSGNAVPTLGDFSVTMRGLWDTVQDESYVEMISQGATATPGFYIGRSPSGAFRLGDTIQTSVPVPLDATFHFYALTSSATDGTRFYIDGVLAYSRSQPIAIAPGGTPTTFGRQFPPYGEFMAGKLDDIGIYSGALTAAEVEALSSPTAVPLPGTLPLAAAGLVLIGVLRRRA